ncbi:hypothetical protein ABZX92_42730 [Lentzea sp. NPDC006480]|uniref:hypothetical protein n=1 Tax=Lentzea sp. NPDC006480 TaxID=3157176 RepID=UPI0033BE6F7F
MTTANEETDATLDRVLSAMRDLRDGNFRRRLVVPGNGPVSALADVFNEIAERNQWLAGELGRVRQAVGQEGRLTERDLTGARCTCGGTSDKIGLRRWSRGRVPLRAMAVGCVGGHQVRVA